MQKSYDKIEYVVRIRTLKQALNHGLVMKKMLRCIKFKQKARLKPCINIKTELKKNGKNDFKNCFFMLMNNTVFWITKVNIRNIRGSKVIKTKARIESKYHTTNIYFQIISNRNEMK